MELFKSVGLPQTKALETAKNAGVSAILTSLISQVLNTFNMYTYSNACSGAQGDATLVVM